jgi:hypothetical protein
VEGIQGNIEKYTYKKIISLILFHPLL